jgi:hypothetical protein
MSAVNKNNFLYTQPPLTLKLLNSPKNTARTKTQSRKLILEKETSRLSGLARDNFSDVSNYENLEIINIFAT